jgi:S-ribosylhomocysteine lyase LuxS involved in autoinducer biosynthesis
MDKKQLTKLVSYFAMGDGGVYYSGKHCKFIMNMRSKNRDYIDWVANTLKEITSVYVREVPDYNTDGCTRQPLTRLETAAHPFFTVLRDRIYVDKYKGLDEHTLKLLDWESLAILYMCDGSLYTDKPNPKKGLVNPSYNVYLHLKRLSYGDQFILKKTLKEKLNLEFNINKCGNYYNMRLRVKDVEKFMQGVTPYMLPSFSYKLIRTENSTQVDGDIVCASQECEEVDGNNLPC